MIAGNIGDTWTYENLDSTQFEWTLSEATFGLFADCQINPTYESDHD